jgi:hypothetical protein
MGQRGTAFFSINRRRRTAVRHRFTSITDISAKTQIHLFASNCGAIHGPVIFRTKKI